MTNLKPDLDRLGYFKELSYHTIGDPYRDPCKVHANDPSVKGRQIFPGPSKTKCGLADGYFSGFTRTFDGEGFTDMIKLKHQERLKNKRNTGRPTFFPPSYPKQPNGLGGFMGSFSGPVQHFSTQTLEMKKQNIGRNIYTNPPKKGSGYGYADVTIGKFPPHESEPATLSSTDHISSMQHKALLNGRREFVASGNIEYFGPDPYKELTGGSSLLNIPSNSQISKVFVPANPGKLPGGMKAGTFHRFPSFIPDPYVDRYKINKKDREIKHFIPSSGSKSARFESIINCNIKKSINSKNYGSVNSILYAF